MAKVSIDALLESVEKGVTDYLTGALQEGRIDEQSYALAAKNTFSSIKSWLKNRDLRRISPKLVEGLSEAIQQERWEDLVNAFRQQARFGTGGIRGMMAFDRESVVRLHAEGIGAPILKGPNTINEVVLLLTSAGVARYGKGQNPPFQKVVIGYDSRVRGFDLAKIVAELFLAYDYTVYFFDEPCPYPEMTFAIPYEGIKADIGILISASHNDYRYNGYKLSCANGSQFDPSARNEMYNKYIAKAKTSAVKLCPFAEAPPERLVFLGGDERLPTFDYCGREDRVMNLHGQHAAHVKTFLMTDLAAQQQAAPEPLHIGYCAFHGAGRRAVPRLLKDVGFADVKVITHGGLNDLNGLFPSFCSDPGREQQPDPGDARAAKTAVEAFRAEYGSFDDVDILIGTDPDADRCGVVVKVPPAQRPLYGGQDWMLLPADSMWALLLWYRLHRETELHGQALDAEKRFIVQSHTTSDSIVLLARKHGLGVIKTWVGFAALAAAVRDVWDGKPIPALDEGRLGKTAELCDPFVCEYQDMNNGQRSFNIGAMEQSNGFSLLGGQPPDDRSLGVGGHVRDKDGTLAALLVAEVAAWAKSQGTTIFELIDKHVFLDPAIGLFVNHYEPDPMDGEYPGIEGDRKKKEILRRALGFFQLAMAHDFQIAGRRAVSACIYRTGKYDAISPPTYDFQFPDEGVRFYLEDPTHDGKPFNHVTVRPSGTGNSLRFHIQLRDLATETDLIEKKQKLMADAKAIADELREILRAPR